MVIQVLLHSLKSRSGGLINMKYLKYLAYQQTNLLLVGLLLVVLFSACSKQNSTYYDFIKTGPVTYTGKADSVKAYAGNGRILLSWLLTSDQTIKTCKVFWNFGADSLTVPVIKTINTDTIRVFIDSLSEGTYDFTVYTYDSLGHHSVGSQAIGNSYGDIFISTIAQKPVRSFTKGTSAVTVVWVGKDARCLGTEWNYTGSDQQAKDYFSPRQDTTFLTSVKVSSPVSYRSLFIPEPNAIDTFYTDYKSLF
jgi:hypothetical protein